MTPRTSAIFTFAYTVLLGFVSGVVGGLVIADRLLTPVAPSGISYSVFRQPQTGPLTDASFIDSSARSMVTFHAKADRGADLVRTAYLPQAAVAQGVVLTSDGWLLSYGGAFSAKASYVAVIGAKAYEASFVAQDAYAGIVYFKVDASDLAAIPFGDSESLAPGTQGVAFDSARGLRALNLLARDEAPAATTDALVQSSEKAQAVLRYAAAPLLPGAAVLDRKGGLVGIVAAPDADSLIAIPADIFVRAIPEVLRTRKVARPYLGVRFVDLSRIAVPPAGDDSPRGAQLKGSLDGRLPAVSPGSPAAKAGLRAGDVILAIEDDLVTAKNSLPDLIAQYAPGQTVAVIYRRGQDERTANITLTAAP